MSKKVNKETPNMENIRVKTRLKISQNTYRGNHKYVRNNPFRSNLERQVHPIRKQRDNRPRHQLNSHYQNQKRQPFGQNQSHDMYSYLPILQNISFNTCNHAKSQNICQWLMEQNSILGRLAKHRTYSW